MALIIQSNGFKINLKKVRLATRHQRQEVTGLTINRFPNVQRRLVRQIRAMLNAWGKYGYADAEREFHQKFDRRKGRLNTNPKFSRVVRGKIEFVGSVRGKADPLYWRLLRRYAQLDIGYVLKEPDDFVEYDDQQLKNAIWVLMDEAGQSTAFFLRGFGMITCAHAITKRETAYAFRSDDPLETQFPVKVRATDSMLDLAIIEVSAAPLKELRFGDDSDIRQLDRVRLMGYPQHHKGAEVSISEGCLVHEYKFEKLRRFHISPQVIQGNSGGPVLNARNQVIGVAIKGGTGQLNAVVPISYLYNLKSGFSGLP